MSRDNLIIEAAKILAEANSLMILTGAGVSAESGFPTFRGENGLWKNHEVTKMATPEGFTRDPKLVWEWYCWRRKLVLDGEPNPGHYAFVEMENLFEQFMLATQNIDNLHQTAGSEKVIEVHGNIFIEKCTACEFKRKSDEIYEDIPKCPECGNMLRPDVVWFGEALPVDALEVCWSFSQNADCIIVAGTSGVVYPAAELPYIVSRNSGKVIEVNLEPSPISNIADVALFGKSGKILPTLIEEYKRNEAKQ